MPLVVQLNLSKDVIASLFNPTSARARPQSQLAVGVAYRWCSLPLVQLTVNSTADSDEMLVDPRHSFHSPNIVALPGS